MKGLTATLSLALLILWLGPVTGHAQGLPKFVRGKLVCAWNVSRAAHVPMTRSARAFLKYRRVSNPRYGDIAVNRRPGGYHAQFVIGHGGGRPICANPSSQKQKWVIQPCDYSWKKYQKIFVRPK